MKKFNYSYIGDLKRKFHNAGIKLYDFTDPSKILDTSDCEFIDGFHGGDVIYAKILKYIASHEPDLADYIQHHYLEKVISAYTGLSMIPNPKITLKSEVDFLCEGCKKELTLPPLLGSKPDNRQYNLAICLYCQLHFGFFQ